MTACVTGKQMYSSKEIAEDVLIDAWTRYNYPRGRGPVAVYLCEDCKHYHLTSSGEMNPKLAQHLKDGKIQLRQEANKWLSKFKKR